MQWPLNRFDALLIAQTYAGRPMTTHHTLEIDRPLALDDWARALERLVGDYPELGSRVELGVRARRLVSSPSRAAIRARLIPALDDSPAALERWIAGPIDPCAQLPIRVRVGPGQIAEQAITLSLHHSVCDGVGALALFDRFTRLAAGDRVAPRRSLPFVGYSDPPRPRLAALARKLGQLRCPAAQLIDGSDPAAVGQQLALRSIDPSLWASLGRSSKTLGASRTAALWHSAATVAARMRLDDASLPIRMVAGVDLRAQLGVPDDALGNWLGTLDYSRDPAHGWTDLHAELASARATELAIETPALLTTVLGRVPPALARAVFRWLDSDAWPTPFSLMLAHLRPSPGRCWPLGLRPRRLWCASTLPRKPGLGLTFTTVGDRVCVAATSQAAVLSRATLERLLDALIDELRTLVGRSPAERLVG